MKLSSAAAWFLFAASASAITAPSSSTDALPKSWGAERYKALIDKSPFALATPLPPTGTKEVVEPTASFAQDYFVVGLTKLGDKDFVTLSQVSDRNTHFSLSTGESHDGIELASVKWVDGVAKSKVTLKKGSEFGEIGFDEAALQAESAPVVIQQPNQGNNPSNNIIRNPFPNGPRMPLHSSILPRQGIVPRPGMVVPPPINRPFRPINPAGRPGFAPPTVPGRTRIIRSQPGQ